MKTRDRIIELAQVRFNELGYGNVTTASLATELGISEGNLWYHFKTKRDLLEAISERFLVAITERLTLRPQKGSDVIEGYIALISAYQRELLDYRVDAIVTASVAMTNELTNLCEAAGIPVVMFNRGQDDPRLSEVTSDNIAGGRAVAQFLIAGGHHRIAHIAGWQGSSTGRDRARGFRDGLAAQGRTAVAEVDGMYNRDTAATVAREIFGTPDRPDAVFVGNDHMAFAVMDVLRFELGLRVPEDVSVVGYDDVPIAAWPVYDLTTIRQPVNRMVSATVEALLSRIAGEPEARHIRIPGPLVLRGSARRPKGFQP